MSADFKPVLCGGMFMCILLEFKARRYGEKINEPEILADLISLIKPSFKAPTRGKTFSNNAALYKSCDLASNTYLPFDDEDLIADFDKRVREKFHEPLAQMDQLIRRKLDYRDPVRTKKMVGSLIGLLENDKTIKNSDSFVFGNGKSCVYSNMCNSGFSDRCVYIYEFVRVFNKFVDIIRSGVGGWIGR